jgi:hypothetical protein
MDRRIVLRLMATGLVGLLSIALIAGTAIAAGNAAAGPTRQISTIDHGVRSVSREPAPALVASAERSSKSTQHGPFGRGLAAGGGPLTAPVLFMFINNIYAATLQDVDGCTSYAAVVDQGGGDQTLGRDLIPDPCVLRHTTNVQSNFVKFLEANLDGPGWGKEVEIALGDSYQGTIVAEVDIASPVMTRFQVPGADATSQAAASFVTTITGSSITPVSRSALVFPTTKATKAALLANFTLRLDETIETGVKQTSPFVFKRDPGERWQLSDYQVTTSFSRSTDFSSWYNKSVLNGPTELERSAQLRFLKADLSGPLFTLNLPAVGLYRADSGFDTTARHWTMYVDSANVSLP